jgi:predicted nucleic acid-binding protein
VSDRLVFLDTWVYRALADRRDPGHVDARQRLQHVVAEGGLPVTSNYVLDEAYTGIRLRAGAQAAVAFGTDVRSLAARSALRLEWIDEGREAKAWRLFVRYTRLRKLSFTDCTSFALMQELGIGRVVTDDRHFEQVNLGFVRV